MQVDLQMSVLREDVVHSLQQQDGDEGIEWHAAPLQLHGWDTSEDAAYVKLDTEDRLGFLVNQTTSVCNCLPATCAAQILQAGALVPSR